MPIYEYECRDCGHRLEALQKISDAPLKDCPACNSAGLQKLISAASFRLKGGGWYETDFKTGNKKQLAESDSAAGKGGDSKAGGSSGSANKDASKAAPAKKSEGKKSEGSVKSKPKDS